MGIRSGVVSVSIASPVYLIPSVIANLIDAQILAGEQNSRNIAAGISVNIISNRPALAESVTPDQDHIYTHLNSVHVLATRTRTFNWIEMLQYDIFPKDIGYNSIGATRFATDVAVVDSGADQRTSRWDQPLMEYDVAYGVRDIDQLQRLNIFFRAMRGRLYSFLYYDPLDHTSRATDQIDYTENFPADPTDQLIATGDGSTKSFQLVKTYSTTSGLTQVRPITKPIEDTVVAAINGSPVSNFTVDLMSGIITFSTPLQLTGLNGMSITFLGGILNQIQITSPTAIFTAFNDHDRIVTNGWATAVNNTNESPLLTINSISPDKKSIVVDTPFTTWQAESGRNGVTIYIHPAPVAGTTISAGYSFYVPVRFDTDRLPISLEEYDVGGAADVKLIEVRPGDL